MLRLLLAAMLPVAAGCGSVLGGGGSTAQTICSNGGFEAAAIDDSFDNIREGQQNGFTRTEMLAVTAQACADSCGADDVCGAACIDCHFAIVDEVY